MKSSEKFGGIRIFGISMLSGKTETFENFGGTEESRKNIKSGKNGTSKKFGGIQTFGTSMLSGKNETVENFGVPRSP